MGDLLATHFGSALLATHSGRAWHKSVVHNTMKIILSQKKHNRSPLKSYNVVPLIASTIAETPLVSNKVLCQILEPYGKPYCFTDAVLQKARVTARRLIFGNPDENDGYAHFLKEDLENCRNSNGVKQGALPNSRALW